MIRYRLQCNKRHVFEAWFGSSAAYDKQAKRGLVECPDCGSTKVEKTLMSPGVATSEKRDQRRARAESERAASETVPADSTTTPSQAPIAPLPVSPEALERAELHRRFVEVMREVRKEVVSKAEYVGPRFAEEARKIHHEETEKRGIWGEATLEEARELAEDGIDCLPLPPLPEDKN